jgi:Tol biopolymer transport system component
MTQDSPRDLEPSRPDGAAERLDSWGEIASHLRRSVRAVQRWEKEEGLPIHRLPHAKRDTVWALRSELDAWSRQRELGGVPPADSETLEPQPAPAAVPLARAPRPRSGAAWLALAIFALAAGGLGLARLLNGHDLREPGPHLPPVIRPLAVESDSEGHPSLSPDGRMVVYQRWPTGGELLIKPTGGGPARPLTRPPAGHFDGYPAWSPRGDTIAFLRQQGWQPRKRDLLIVAAQGGTERRITDAGGVGLAWSPDGRSLAFVDSDSAGEPHSIFLVSVDTGSRQRLTSPPLGTFGDLFCAFSPNGRSLAFTRWPTLYAGDVWIMPASGGEPRRITQDALASEGLDWTPDGRAVVFSSRRGGLLGLWRVSVDGKAAEPPAPVAGTMGGARFPSFSRPSHGGTSALAYEYAARDVNIWRFAASSGKGKIDQVVASTWYDDHPAISRDGRRLAFASNRTGFNEIWTADADGTGPVRLTFRNGARALAPCWSPDGQSIAYTAQVGDNRDIYVVGADGAGSRRLTSEPSDEGNPSFSRDGRWIYFRSDRNGVPQIWKAPTPGGRAVQVTTGEGSQALEAPDGKVVYFVRSVALPGVWSVPVGGGRETLVVPDAKEGFWAVADPGIYYLAAGGSRLDERWGFERFGFASRTITRIATEPTKPVGGVHGGFSVSQDGHSIVWAQVDSDSHDIMLLEPWFD